MTELEAVQKLEEEKKHQKLKEQEAALEAEIDRCIQPFRGFLKILAPILLLLTIVGILCSLKPKPALVDSTSTNSGQPVVTSPKTVVDVDSHPAQESPVATRAIEPREESQNDTDQPALAGERYPQTR
jgi:hypothetical protein